MKHYYDYGMRLIFLVVFSILFLPVASVVAQAENDLEAKIRDRNEKIAALEKEISEYENTLTAIGGQKKTLEGEIKILDVSRKKISADIKVTENKIESAQLKLDELKDKIIDKEERITISKAVVIESIRSLYEMSDMTIAEHLLKDGGFQDSWLEADKLRQFEHALRYEIRDLLAVKESLTVNFNEIEKQQRTLQSLKRDLSGQKSVLDQNRKEQSDLLLQTKSKESEYQKLLQAKQQAKLEFEQELREFENALDYTLDPTRIPRPGTGVLAFPLDPLYMIRCKDKFTSYKNIYCISQYFGNTSFAQGGAYNGKGHNGIDFGAPQGTRVVAALTGTIEEMGNTDLYPRCYSYGKWILIRHNNGLSTLYAHLSIISVQKGDIVSTGATIGYSGRTGYATGPHLHFSVYASEGVKMLTIGQLKTKTNCANAIIPVAPTSAYLNPFQYL